MHTESTSDELAGREESAMKSTLRRLVITATLLTAALALAITSVSAADSEVRSLEISASELTLEAGTDTGLSVALSYSGSSRPVLDWSSSDSNVATIEEGSVTAHNPGTAMITASCCGISDSCIVTVRAGEPSWEDTADCYTELNKYRKARHSKKIRSLKRDKRLEKVAMARAKEMAESGKFSHTRPNGKSALTLIKGRKAKGENIAKGQTSAAEVTADWYASPSHRKNMLRKNFKKVGIAAYTYKGVTYWAEEFSS